jgi:colanic acid/amylovoran biosynthesis glycosyltransferase
MRICFARTETFIYDFVRGCRRYEAWCLAKGVERQSGYDFQRVCCTQIQWQGNSFWDRVDRFLYGLFRRPDVPIYRALLLSIRPAVIHAHFGYCGWEILPYARKCGIPLLTSFYGYDVSGLPREPGWGEKLRQLFECGAGFLVEGPVMARRLQALGCPLEKIHLLPITIHPETYPYRPRCPGPSETLRILFVGRLIPKKGLPVLIEALALARPQLGPFELRVVGGGPLGADIHALTARLGLQECVRFLGSQPRTEVVRQMGESHLLAVPSATGPDGDTEGGAPTVLLEAQASGLPVLASDHADIPFVVAAPYRAFLAAEGSPTSLADRLLAMRANASHWLEAAAAGREHVCAQHGPRNFNQLERLYARVARRAPAVASLGS